MHPLICIDSLCSPLPLMGWSPRAWIKGPAAIIEKQHRYRYVNNALHIALECCMSAYGVFVVVGDKGRVNPRHVVEITRGFLQLYMKICSDDLVLVLSGNYTFFENVLQRGFRVVRATKQLTNPSKTLKYFGYMSTCQYGIFYGEAHHMGVALLLNLLITLIP